MLFTFTSSSRHPHYFLLFFVFFLTHNPLNHSDNRRRCLYSDPIEWDVQDVPAKMMNNYCWTHSQFLIPSNDESGFRKGNNCQYYQWMYVQILICVQIVLCYTPYHLWKSLELGKMKSFVSTVNSYCVDKQEEKCPNDLILKNVDRFLSTTHAAVVLLLQPPNTPNESSGTTVEVTEVVRFLF